MVKYTFVTQPPDTYKLTFELETDNTFFQKVFNTSIGKLGYKLEEQKENFTILPRYNAVLHTAFKIQIRQVKKEVAQDGIIMQTSYVVKAVFIKKKDRWLIKIEVGGLYARK